MSGAAASPAISAQRRGRGFTLVEILVVVAIIAIGSAAAWSLWRGADTRGRRTAEAFAGALAYAAQRAQWRHEDLGVSTGPRDWRFWYREASSQRWMAVGDDPLLEARGLPDGLEFASVALAGRGIDRDAVVPLRATGRNDPASWVLADSDRRWQIDADILNRVAVTSLP